MAFPFSLCCDLRVVAPEALFVTSFAQRGLIAEWGLSWLLPRLVGPAVALDLLFSSRRVSGDEAHRLGLANYLVSAVELLPFCREYVEAAADARELRTSRLQGGRDLVRREAPAGVPAAAAQRVMIVR
jgi:enoyl-CoA hydratase/carnithine racemase